MLGHAEHSPVGATLGRGGGTNPPFPTKDEQPCTAWPEQVGATSQPPCPSEPALQDAGATRPAPPNERAMDRSQGVSKETRILKNCYIYFNTTEFSEQHIKCIKQAAFETCCRENKELDKGD